MEKPQTWFANSVMTHLMGKYADVSILMLLFAYNYS